MLTRKQIKKIRAKKQKEVEEKYPELIVTCGKCGIIVRPLFDSAVLDWYVNGECDLKEAKKILFKTHDRHAHTGYDGHINYSHDKELSRGWLKYKKGRR